MQGYSPFLITVPYSDLSRSEENDSLLIGPGNGLNEENDEIMSKLLSLDKPTLLDADGIKTLNRCKYTRKRPIVVTPHRKEFEILTGMEATEDNAYSYSRKTGNVVLLKGKVDIIIFFIKTVSGSDKKRIIDPDADSIARVKRAAQKTGDINRPSCSCLALFLSC